MKRPIVRRLLPLYVTAFLTGIPFWYAVEKLFMLSIGFNSATIGLMVACMSLWILVVETPSGILADRWSRKGVLIIAAVTLFASALVGGFSNSVPIFIFYALLWGTFSAMYSGTVESVIYDTLVEEQGTAAEYEQYYGRLRMVEGASFVVGALVGGQIAVELGLRETFFLSLPLLGLAVVVLFALQEPVLHKKEAQEHIILHTKQTFAAILKNTYLKPIVIATVGFSVLLSTLFELNQLWFIGANTPLWAFGMIAAIVFVTWSLGGALVRRIKQHIRTTLLLILVCLLFLPLVRTFELILLIMFVLCTLLVGLGIVLSGLLQDELPSKLRAGATSFLSTMSNAIIVPFSLLLTTVAQRHDIFLASYLLLVVGGLGSLAYTSIKTKA